VKQHALRVAEEMRLQGDEVTVVGPLGAGVSEPGSRGFGGVVNFPANGGANRIAVLTSPLSVRRFFRSASFDVVHVHEPLTPLLPYYALWFSPSAAHVCTFHMYAEREPLPLRAARRVFGRGTLASYERAIAVSSAAASYASLVWKRELSLVPNGVSTATFVPGRRWARLPVAGDPLRLLFVGRWDDRRKGLRHLLEAYARLQAAGLPVTLDVVGTGTRGRLPIPAGVTLHGNVPSTAELARHYRECDVFVSPALGQESFGIVLLEAMASARPIVCSDIAGYREVADPAGASMVPPGDACTLARAIADLARNPSLRRSMGRANRAKAERYDWHGVAEKTRLLYVEAIGERHGLVAARAHEAAAAEAAAAARHWGGATAEPSLLRTRS